MLLRYYLQDFSGFSSGLTIMWEALSIYSD